MNDHPTTRPRTRDDVSPVGWTAAREEWHFMAGYYAWNARKGFAPGARDPRTGQPWKAHDRAARRLGRAAYLALAREAYAIAREYGPTPLP